MIIQDGTTAGTATTTVTTPSGTPTVHGTTGRVRTGATETSIRIGRATLSDRDTNKAMAVGLSEATRATTACCHMEGIKVSSLNLTLEAVVVISSSPLCHSQAEAGNRRY